ncbi:hypothetical protein EX30DRAFT_372642 [Ascodesmis nigricans]|uniref:Uncharacterized protein n=1 Tax=Ascodesmis nigricans TaxID=341454 RepID=A0A4S2MTQ3_9PEZI|nr:hypothetical protein EX30DRAFT_372642 [Ascodesmis nigricans]
MARLVSPTSSPRPTSPRLFAPTNITPNPPHHHTPGQSPLTRARVAMVPAPDWLDPLLAFYQSYKPTLIFIFYHSTVTLLFLHQLFTLLPRIRPSFPWRTFTFLSIISLLLTWSHILLFYRASFLTFQTRVLDEALHAAPSVTEQHTMHIGLNEWLRGTKLFDASWRAVVMDETSWWWTQQLMFATMAWTVWIAVEGARRGVSRWRRVSLMLVGQFVAISVAVAVGVLMVGAFPLKEKEKKMRKKKKEEEMMKMKMKEEKKLNGIAPGPATRPNAPSYAAVAAKTNPAPSRLPKPSTTTGILTPRPTPPPSSTTTTLEVAVPNLTTAAPIPPYLPNLYTPLFLLLPLLTHNLPYLPSRFFLPTLLSIHLLLFLPLTIFPRISSPPQTGLVVYIRRLYNLLVVTSAYSHVRYTYDLVFHGLDGNVVVLVEVVGEIVGVLAPVLKGVERPLLKGGLTVPDVGALWSSLSSASSSLSSSLLSSLLSSLSSLSSSLPSSLSSLSSLPSSLSSLLSSISSLSPSLLSSLSLSSLASLFTNIDFPVLWTKTMPELWDKSTIALTSLWTPLHHHLSSLLTTLHHYLSPLLSSSSTALTHHLIRAECRGVTISDYASAAVAWDIIMVVTTVGVWVAVSGLRWRAVRLGDEGSGLREDWEKMVRRKERGRGRKKVWEWNWWGAGTVWGVVGVVGGGAVAGGLAGEMD